MKILNLVSAIIFTVIYALLLLVAVMEYDYELFLGVVVMSVPVIVNWITFAMWDDKKQNPLKNRVWKKKKQLKEQTWLLKDLDR